MSDENEDLAKLMAIVNQEDDEEDEEQLTEEELQQALNSPSLHRHIIDEESTECDDYEMSSGDIQPNKTTEIIAESDQKMTDESVGQQTVKSKPGEYQFQMLDHHIFKGKHGKKLYKCDVCYAVYRHSFSLKRHFIRSHINYGYLCETDVTNCGINLSASASLQTWKEQQQRSGQTQLSPDLPDLYCCHSCVLFYDELAQIKGHVDDCHRNNSSGTIEPIRIPCSECNMSFIQRHNLMRHIEVVHNGKRLYACKHCSKKFQTIADRKKHEKSQHPELSGAEDQPQRPVASVTSTVQKSSTSTAATHKCLKCSQLFTTYGELKKHVNRKHKEFYNPCGFCNKFCFSKKQLSTHLRQKHEKTAKDNANKLKQKNKQSTSAPAEDMSSVERSPQTRTPISSSQTMSQQNQNQAYFHCSLCYRRFLTYGSLIRHKQIAHRPQVRNCSRLNAEPQLDPEVVEPFNRGNEFEFYRSLAQKMAENLLYFVDGKSVNPSNDYKVIRNPNHRKIDPTVPEIDLQKYNFPEGFRYNPSPVSSYKQKEKQEFLFDCNLNTVKNPNFKPLIVETTPVMSEPISLSTTTTLSEVNPKSLFICTVCHQKITAELKPEHEANNHPNVRCSYIEIEPQMRNIPSQLLLWQYHNPEGLLNRCTTAPSLSRAEDDDTSLALNCTKCEKSFASVSLLHNHILECAHISGSKKKLINNNNKSHNNAETQTPITANTSTTSNTTIVNTSSDSQTEANTSQSSETTEKDFSSPLSPCKTRSGKRRQISPEDYVKTKRTRNASKNLSNDSKTSQKSNTQNSGTDPVIKDKDTDIGDKSDKQIDKKQINENNKSSVETKSSPEVSKNLQTVPKNLNSVSKDDNSNSKSTADCLPKRYFCEKCSKRFVYMDSLSKHLLSCNKRLIQSKVNTKRNLRNSPKIPQKLAKNIELKAIKNVRKVSEKQNPNKNSSVNKTTKSVAKQLTEEDFKEDTEEEEEAEGEDIEEVTVDREEEEESKTEEETKDDSEESDDNSSTPETDAKQTATDKSVRTVSNESPGNGHQEHRCPDCLRLFTYVANFRKHITNVCPVRKQLNESTSSESTTSQPINTSTPLSKGVTAVAEIVIKEENPDPEHKDVDPSDAKDGTDDEIVFEGETKVELSSEDVDEGSVSPKDESKLDLWRVKQENPQFAFKGSPAQHHSCPYCQRGFTYLANYRKHIKGICPIRQQIDEKKKQVIEDSADTDADESTKHKPELSPAPWLLTPPQICVRSQIEDTVLTLLRDQTKQDQILQSSESLIKANTESKTDLNSSSGGHQRDAEESETKSDSKENSETNSESKTEESDKTKDVLKKDSTQQSTPVKGSTFKFRTFSCSICHKIFLSYVKMLKHRLLHKLSDGSLATNENNTNHTTNETAIDNSTQQTAATLTTTVTESADNNNESIETNNAKEAANQALASSILKRSKDVLLNKMRLNSQQINNTTNTSPTKTRKQESGPKTVINTTELLEKLARGGIPGIHTTDSIQKTLNNNNNNKSSSKAQEVITIETNNNNTNILNLQLSASTSSSSANNNLNANNGLEDIIIDTNDLELDVLKDGVIMSPDIQQLITVNDGKDSTAVDGLPVNEVLLNLDDIENGNEVWITITDSNAYVNTNIS